MSEANGYISAKGDVRATFSALLRGALQPTVDGFMSVGTVGARIFHVLQRQYDQLGRSQAAQLWWTGLGRSSESHTRNVHHV